MSETNTGGPAFPCQQDPINQNIPSLGMTMRDYFAAKAMAALILRPHTYEIDTVGGIEATASNSYAFADAMLKERES